MTTPPSGFLELPHTADWCLRVWAGSLEELFVQAARGMNSIAGMQAAPGPRLERTFTAQAEDLESLLVQFLSELVYAAEQEKLVFDDFCVKIEDRKLDVRMSGALLAVLNKSIKAVTYHNLQIRRTGTGFQVEIVFDV
jgi:SHS2 domain-containing protein